MTDYLIGNVNPYDNVVSWFTTGIGYVLNAVRVIGTALAVIMLTYLAFRYITAHGPEAKSKLREGSTGYAIGAVVFIAASNIIYFISQLVIDIVADIATTSV